MRNETFSLTQTQLGMYLEWTAERTSLQYNLPVENVFPGGAVDAAKLAAAVRTVLDAYPVFRLRLVEQAGEVVQFIDENLAPAVEERSAREADMAQIRTDFIRPFDPFTGPMVRVSVVTTETATHLLTDFFHLVSDGTGYRVFAAALAAAYDGRALPKEEMTFADYAVLEPSLFEQEAYRTAKADHAARFAGKTMTVPEGDGGETEKAGGGGQGKDPACLVQATVRMPRAEVEAFCRAHGVHPNLLFMGAFARTLALYANTSEAVFFTVNHGRRDARLRGTLGAFVKTVPVLAELAGEKSLVDFLQSLKLHKVGDYPFTHFCRDLGMTPGFGYVFQDGTVDLGLRVGEAVPETAELGAMGAGHHPTLEIGGDAQSYELKVAVLPGAYSEPWCAAFVERIAEVTRQFLAHPDAKLADIPVVSTAEAKDLVALSRGADLPYDASATFVDLFDRRAAAQPDRTAVVDCDGSLSYGELAAASRALAATLVEKGVTPGSFVGIKLPRRASFLVSALAVQRCGAGYVPLDPDYPADRIAYMVEDSGAKVVVDEAFVEEGQRSKAKGQTEEFNHHCLTSDLGPLTLTSDLDLAKPESPAYMIYTSGSTGRPKGVVVSQRALVAFCAWVADEFKLDADSRMGVTASFSFDASVMDLFPPLTAGGEVHLFSETLRKDLAGMRAYAEEKKMTGWTMSTQLGLAMLNAYPDVPLRTMLVGGEKILPFAKTDVRVYNGYGPTEFTVASSFQVVDQSAEGEVPIGRPVPNSYSFVCDRFGQLVPRGLVGELCLSGVQIAEGYWNRPEKTKESFVPLPLFNLQPSTFNLMYRTGDYACYDDEGRLLYRGRIDSQVKLRGFRIEIGEIEHTASTFPGIGAVAAEVRTLAGTQHLVLYYEKAKANVAVEALKAHLAASLTAYMVPDYFVALEKMPLTPVGKIDRKALPDPALSDEPVVAPANEVEKAILAVVCAVLRTDAIGVTHDLERSGLTSLGAMALVAKLKKECGIVVTLSELAAAKTVRELAERAGMSAAGMSAAGTPPRRGEPGRGGSALGMHHGLGARTIR